MKLTQADITKFLDQVKPLTLDQYDTCKIAVQERIRELIGEKPTREELARDEGSLTSPLDWMAFVVFIFAFIVSSVHIIVKAGEMASHAWASSQTTVGDLGERVLKKIVGISFAEDIYTIIHQVGFVFLAETSMLLFLVTWRMEMHKEGQKWYYPGPLVNLILAVIAMSFVITSNLSSGLSVLEALMPPIFTIGIGFHLEKLIVEFINRRSTLTQRLTEALELWETAQEDPTKHPEYRPYLVREIWEKVSRLKDNREYVDAAAPFKWAVVMRELARDTWAHDQVQVAQASGDEGAAVQEESGLRQLMSIVKKSPEKITKANALITLTDYEVDMVGLTWTDKKAGKTYGPYKSRYNMTAGMGQVAKMRERKADVQE